MTTTQRHDEADLLMVFWLFMGVCLSFLAVGIAVSWQTQGQQLQASDLMVADRRIQLWLACMTMAATWIGGGYINGTAEAVYDREQGIVWCQAPWCYALSLIVAGLVFARPMRHRGYRTMLDLFEFRFGSRVTGLLFIPALIGDMFWTAAILGALGGTLGTLFGVDSTLAISISAGIVIAYTMWGGLWSVACSDVLQLAFIVFGLGITLPFVIAQCGGVHEMVSGYVTMFGDRSRPIPPLSAWGGENPWAWQWIDSALLLILGGIPWQVYFQRVLACRSANAAMWMSILAGFVCLTVAIGPATIGMAGVSLDWAALGTTQPERAAQILPYVLRYALPPTISVMGLMALVAAVMSSMDSSILSSASMFAWNVYRPLLRPKVSDAQLQRIIRGAILALGGTSIVMALSVTSVYQLWFLSSDVVYVILFPQLVMALFARRATPAGSLAGIVVGGSLRLLIGLLLAGAFAALPGLNAWAATVSLLPWRTGTMLASLATIWVVSYFTPSLADAASSPA